MAISTETGSAEIRSVIQWLDDVVIGLNLCPFAAKPRKHQQIRISSTDADNEQQLLEDLFEELQHLSVTAPEQTDTSILVVSHFLKDFHRYNQFLQLAENLLYESGLNGIIQIASFHPEYQFAGTQPTDSENLTNRSPLPLLHLIREDSISQALRSYPTPEKIFERNIRRMETLSEKQIDQLFPFLKS